MEIAVFGTGNFTNGFRLAGVGQIYDRPESNVEMERILRQLLHKRDIGILVVHPDLFEDVSIQTAEALANSVQPTVIAIGGEEDTTLRQMIKKAVGVDLWKD